MKITIGITCVGSGIGQSVVDALRLCGDTFRIIGFDLNPLSYGGLYCDAFYSTKPNQEPGYIDSLVDTCKKERVQVIIPGLDSDLLLLSRERKKFEKQDIKVLVSPESVIELCRDKKRLSQELCSLFPEFVASYSNKEAREAVIEDRIKFPLIAKPIDGSGSMGICITRNSAELNKLSKGHIVQPYICVDSNDPEASIFFRGMENGEVIQVAEISVQYLMSKRGEVIGRIATRNKLKMGVPIEIIPIDIPLIWESTQKIIEHFISLGAWGPINLQGRLYSKGFHIFEVNPRFTGITGLRAKLGFNEVEACLLDYVGTSQIGIKRVLDYNFSHVGVRQINDLKLSSRTKPSTAKYIRKRRIGSKDYQGKVILLTGATGYIGQNLVSELVKKAEIERIIAVARNEQKAKSVFGSINDQKLCFWFLEDIPVRNWNLGQVDSVIHLGSARPPDGITEITKSLEFTKNLVLQTAAYQVPEFIYVSSQSVYGEKNDSILWNESSLSSPDSPYGMAKLAGEMFVQGLKQFIPQSRIWILRLSRVYGKGYGMRWHEMPHKLVADFWQKKEISIKGGKQRFDFIHIKDVLSGICCVLKTNHNQNNGMYNLGSGHSVGIRDLADCINNAAEKMGLKKVPIRIVPGEDERKFGMDTTLFCRDFNWKPGVSLEKGMRELVHVAEEENLFLQDYNRSL